MPPKCAKLLLTWLEEKYLIFLFLFKSNKTVPLCAGSKLKFFDFWVRVKIFWPLGQVKKQLLKVYFLNWDLFTIWHNLLNAFFSSSQKSIHPMYYTVWNYECWFQFPLLCPLWVHSFFVLVFTCHTIKILNNNHSLKSHVLFRIKGFSFCNKIRTVFMMSAL